MKLFTIFTTDERALEHVRAQRARIATLVKRVANQQEWGVRVVLDRTLGRGRAEEEDAGGGAAPARRYLSQKKAQRDASQELASRARETVADAVRSAGGALAATRSAASASELPAQGGPLLLDAAFLVPRARAATFKALAARESTRAGASGLRPDASAARGRRTPSCRTDRWRAPSNRRCERHRRRPGARRARVDAARSARQPAQQGRDGQRRRDARRRRHRSDLPAPVGAAVRRRSRAARERAQPTAARRARRRGKPPLLKNRA